MNKVTNLKDNPDGTCNCSRLGNSCFFTDLTGGRCKCSCHSLEDTPAHTRGWEERFENNRPPQNWEENNGYDEDDESQIKEFGYKHYCGQTHTIHTVTDWVNIKNFIKSELERRDREFLKDVIDIEITGSDDYQLAQLRFREKVINLIKDNK